MKRALRALRAAASWGRWPAMALLALAAAPMAGAQARHEPVLVELFTSQGCSSCPRANALVGAVAREPNTIALTYAVTYWDYLGWRDTFARPEFNTRQKWYAARFHRGVYTPQIVVNGSTHGSAQQASALRALLDATPAARGARISLRARDGRAAITVSGAHAEGAVWLAQYQPGPAFVSVRRGENAGARVPHYNVVTALSRLGDWRGGAARFEGVCQPACAVIVQADSGRVLAAAQTR